MAQPLNICLTSRRFPLADNSGDVGFLWPIARGLVRQGYSVTVLSWRNRARRDFVEKEGVKAYFLGEGHTGLVESFPELALRKFQLLHRQTPFHLVHSLDASGLQV